MNELNKSLRDSPEGRPVSDAAGLGDFVPRHKYSAVEFGRRVAELRDSRGLSRKDLAQALGMSSESAISEIENGRNQKKYEQLAGMAEVLGTSPDVLLGFSEMPVTADSLDMMGAAVKRILTADGWPPERAEALVGIATEVALEKSEVDLDRRLSAAYRRHALSKPT